MTTATFWLGRATLVAVVLTVAVCLTLGFGSPESQARRALRHHLSELDRRLSFLRANITAVWIFTAQVVSSLVCVAVALLLKKYLLLALLLLTVFGPSVLIERRVAARVTRLEEQIEPWLNAVTNALKASPSLGDAIASTPPLLQSPMSEEVDILVKEYELGTPLDRALDNLAERIPSNTLAGAILALKVARRTGGELTKMLESSAEALRELTRLAGVVRTKTAEGKAQTLIISIIPVPMVLAVHSMDPLFFAPLQETFVGHLVIAGAATLWAVAILLARKIVAVDI